MKLYISADMEGVAFHTGWDMVTPGGKGYEASQVRMTEEVNAALGGAFDAGVTEAVVNDSHDGMRNLLPDLLDPRAQVITGSPKPWSMVQGLDPSYDLAFFVGYHAMAGGNGVLAHTYSGDPISVTVNGIPMGESGINALVAGHYGVPVALVTGDDVVCQEVRTLLPWMESVQVKVAMNRFGAKSLGLDAARAAIRAGAARAVGRKGQMRPLALEGPLVLHLEYGQAGKVDLAAFCPGAERTGPRTVAFEAKDALELFRAFRTMNNMASLARD